MSCVWWNTVKLKGKKHIKTLNQNWRALPGTFPSIPLMMLRTPLGPVKMLDNIRPHTFLSHGGDWLSANLRFTDCWKKYLNIRYWSTNLYCDNATVISELSFRNLFVCLCVWLGGGGDWRVTSMFPCLIRKVLQYCSESQVTIVDSCTNAIQYI